VAPSGIWVKTELTIISSLGSLFFWNSKHVFVIGQCIGVNVCACFVCVGGCVLLLFCSTFCW